MSDRPFGTWLLNVATSAVTLCAVLVATVRVREGFFPPGKNGEVAPARVANWRQYTRHGVRLGPLDPAVTIVEFSDFTCPFCARLAPDLREIRRRYPTNVAVVYRHFLVHGPRSKYAAWGAECALRMGAFEPFHDVLFAQRDSISAKPMTRLAVSAGIKDTAAFQACMKDTTTLMRAIALDTLAGQALGVRGTPTLLINDLKVAGNPGLERLEKYVTDILNRKRQGQ